MRTVTFGFAIFALVASIALHCRFAIPLLWAAVVALALYAIDRDETFRSIDRRRRGEDH